MPVIEVMRAALRDLYSANFAAKVDKMTDSQVIAIYLKFKEEGKIR